MMRRFHGVFAVVFIVMLAVPALSLGHTSLSRSDPQAGAVLDAAPTSVKLWFSHNLESGFSNVAVYDGNDHQVDLKNSKVNPQDKKAIEVGLPALPPGTYKVRWGVAGRDGHRMKGDFTFTVKAP